MAVTRRPTAGAYPAKHLRQPNAYWRSKGLVLSFLGNRLIYSRDTPVIPSVTQTGTPKRQSGPHSDAIGFGTTFGTGTTDMLTGGVLPVTRTGARSVFTSVYYNGTGGGALGRIFQDVTGSGIAGGESFYCNGTTQIIYNNYIVAGGAVASWLFSATPPISRWSTIGISIPDISGLVTNGRCYQDGKLTATVANSVVGGGIGANIPTNLTWGNRTSDGARNIDGMIGVTHFFEEALSPEDFADLDANPDCVWEVLDVRRTAAGSPSHPTSGTLVGGTATVAGTAARLRAMTSSGALTGGGAAVVGTATHLRSHATSGALSGGGATLSGTAARAGGAATHDTSGNLSGQGAQLSGTAHHAAAHATNGTLAGTGATLAGTAARTAAPVTHVTSGTLVGGGATLSGTAQNGAFAPLPPTGGGGGAGGSRRAKHNAELDELLTKALRKPVEVAVQLLLPKAPSADAIALVRTALQERETTVTKSAARQVQSLVARLQVLEREAEEEEAVVMMLLLD